MGVCDAPAAPDATSPRCPHDRSSASERRCLPTSRWPAPAPAGARPVAAGSLRALCSSAVFRVDFHVVEGEITSPDRGLGFAAIEHRAHFELGLLHRRYPLLLAVRRIPAATMDHAHLVDVQVDAGGIDAPHARIADRREATPEARVPGEE